MEKEESQWSIIAVLCGEKYSEYSLAIIGNFLGQEYEGPDDETIIISDVNGNVMKAFLVDEEAVKIFLEKVDPKDPNLNYEIFGSIGRIGGVRKNKF